MVAANAIGRGVTNMLDVTEALLDSSRDRGVLGPQVLGNDAMACTLDRLVSSSDGLLHHISEGGMRDLGRLGRPCCAAKKK